MSFTSVSYYIFLLITALVYFNLPGRLRNFVLLAASYFFYTSFEPRYLIFILTTTVVSYFSALIISKSDNNSVRLTSLSVALGVEVVLLGATKYWNPIAQSTSWLSPIDILVPLGISFYTFQTIGYLFDVYRKTLPVEKNYIRYSLFLSFFPHLLAGPIEPANHFLPQLRSLSGFEKKAAAVAVLLILTGLFKKLVIADHLSLIVNIIFDEPSKQGGLAVAVGLVLARYQIYSDFSGYTDIALGSAQLLGFQLSPNFNRPFSASSISEYWRRWHISLGVWIRNYIFYPLVSTSFSCFGVHGLILITFLVLGIWHGGTFNYLIYGLWHGLFVITDIKTKNLRLRFYHFSGLSSRPNLLKTLATTITFFLIVVPPTLFFRSTSFDISLILLNDLLFTDWKFSSLYFISNSLVLSSSLYVSLASLVGLELVHWWFKKNNIKPSLWSYKKLYGCSFLILIVIIIFGRVEGSAQFIYTQF